MNGIQLVCFDLGRVLIRICDSWAKACEAAGVLMPAAIEPATYERILEVGRHHGTGAIDTRQFVEETARITGLTPEQVAAVSAAWLRGPYPGVFELIERLTATGVQTACLTNTNDRHWRQMTTPGDPNFLPLNRLTYRFASHMIGHAKPSAASYQYVEQTSGVAGASILFFDDEPDNVAAAQQRNWTACRIELTDDTVVQMTQHLSNYGIL